MFSDEKLFESDINRFFNSSYMSYLSDFLLEDFQQIKDNQPTIEGTVDLYEITLRNGLIFHVYVNYTSPDKTEDKINKKIVSANHKNSKEIGDNYKKYFSNLQSNEYVGIILFEDSKNRTELTGEVGPAAQELFKTLQNVILHSIFEQNRINDLRGFMVRVSKNEPKRIKLYETMIRRYLKQHFPNMFIDDTTDGECNLIVATK